MITVICGEDTATSRRQFVQLRTQYTQKGYEIKDITPQQIFELPKWLADSVSLFGGKQVFFVERLESVIVRRRGRKSSKPADPASTESILENLAKDRSVEIIDWEEKSGREVKTKEMSLVKEYKVSDSIFKLLDMFVPGGKIAFIDTLRKVAETQEEMFIFIMFYRYIRTLILAHEGVFAKTVQSWQQGKLAGHARKFDKERLIEIYQALYRLELSNKTGNNPQGLRKSLEILACYYL